MAHYLFIESRDPFDSNAVAEHYAWAGALAGAGHAVTLFLVQNGVMPARRCEMSAAVGELARGGVEILADEFSLRERGMARDSLIEGVRAAPLSVVVDHLAEGRKCLWH